MLCVCFLNKVLLAPVGRMETKAVEQRYVCIRQLLYSVNQCCPSKLILGSLPGHQTCRKDVVRTFSGGAALIGVRSQKASVP